MLFGVEVTTGGQLIGLVRLHGAAGDQPAQWTLIDLTCPDDAGDELARRFAAALSPGRWYADYATDSTSWVVFAGRVFTYPRGDDTGRQEAVIYARDVGVPEA
ncbi:hypothetical protein ACQP1S_21140 [Micromonospora matsumotoense]|uniref:hypothetical protein n=1 Tax=Micromonospora matsumotoense TaxID=121616 RepID=UPI003D94A22B